MKLAAERREAILRAARLRGTVRVTEVAERLGVSTVTIRRDVTALVTEGVLERVHGGAVLRAGPDPRGTSGERPPRHPTVRATIGMVVPSAHYYYPRVIQGAEAAAGANGVRLILAISHYYPTEDRRQVDRLLDLGVDALLLTTSSSPDEDPEMASWIAGLPVPTVLVERLVDLPQAASVEYVRTDHTAGARLAIQHLATLGHERIALAARENSPTTRWLLNGHAQSVTSGLVAGDTPQPFLLPPPESDPAARTRHLNDVLDTCTSRQVHAVIVHSDEDAVELTRIATARGLAVPGDLAIVAYDDEIAALADVPLTAVAPPKHDVGRSAIDMAVRRLMTGSAPAAQHLSLLPQLVVRTSCGAPDAARPPGRR